MEGEAHHYCDGGLVENGFRHFRQKLSVLVGAIERRNKQLDRATNLRPKLIDDVCLTHGGY